MTDHYTRALNLIDDMLHMMDQRPDGPQSAWYKAAWALMQEKPNRGLVYQLLVGSGEWEEITESEYQFALRLDFVTGDELRILHTAPPAQVLNGFRIVGAAELAMVLNALNRDAEEGRPVRKEMADALASSVDRGLAALAAAPQPKESI